MLKTFCLVLLIGLCASSDTSSLLHRLFGKRSRSSPPVILILDKNTLRPLVNQREGHNSYDSSDETETLQHLIQHLAKSQKSKSHGHAAHHSRSHPHSSHHSSRDRNLQEHEDNTRSHDHDRLENSIDDFVAPKSVLRSPIYKSLLTLRNSLQCGAKNECQDECGNSLKGSKKAKCENKCEKKFDCQEDKKEERDCGDSCEDSSEPPKNECETNQCQGSTKGILFEPEPVGCKRC